MTQSANPAPDIDHLSIAEGSSKTGKRKKAAPKSDSYGSRRSKRAKPEKDPFKQVVVHIGKSDTVRDLKLKVRGIDCHHCLYACSSSNMGCNNVPDMAQNILSTTDHAKDPYCAHLPEAVIWSTGTR